VNLLNPKLKYFIPQLLDIGGPTLSDPSIDALVVSEESENGATFINQEREKKGWNILHVNKINLVANHTSLSSDIKLSSTSLRQQEYESMKKEGEL